MEVQIRVSYFVIPIIALGIAAVGRFFTNYGMEWYGAISLTLFITPIWFMSLIWDVVDVISTTTVVIVWNQFERGIRFWLVMALFVVNAFLNVYWSYLFFHQHQVGAALLDALLLELTIFLLIFLIWPVSHKTTYLLIPYAGWLMMTIALNIIIWLAV